MWRTFTGDDDLPNLMLSTRGMGPRSSMRVSFGYESSNMSSPFDAQVGSAVSPGGIRKVPRYSRPPHSGVSSAQQSFAGDSSGQSEVEFPFDIEEPGIPVEEAAVSVCDDVKPQEVGNSLPDDARNPTDKDDIELVSNPPQIMPTSQVSTETERTQPELPASKTDPVVLKAELLSDDNCRKGSGHSNEQDVDTQPEPRNEDNSVSRDEDRQQKDGAIG